ncbi:MAG: tryptophan synthase subunit alpha [Planctomycetota bacterium]|jgi:tryptophan synthase alpha chain
MPRIDDIFARLRAEGRTAIIPFITAGYPSLDATEQAIDALEAAGAPIIELGIPFSDPIADGPVIAGSMHEALQAGVTPAAVFELVKRFRRDHAGSALGLVAMVSDSIVARIGPERFVAEAAGSGFDGLIIPDVDTAAAGPAAGLAALHNLGFTLLVAPSSPQRRLEQIVGLCRGFVYVLARVGITGEREAIPPVAERVAAVRQLTTLPVAVGFGISRPEHVAAVTSCADAAIVGSALVRCMGEAGDAGSAAAAAGDLVRQLSKGLARR